MSTFRISLSPFDKENETKYEHYLALRLVFYPAEIPRQAQNKVPQPRKTGMWVWLFEL